MKKRSVPHSCSFVLRLDGTSASIVGASLLTSLAIACSGSVSVPPGDTQTGTGGSNSPPGSGGSGNVGAGGSASGTGGGQSGGSGGSESSGGAGTSAKTSVTV